MKPSLGRVAVSAFYPDRHCPAKNMEGQCNRHTSSPLIAGVNNRLPLCSVSVQARPVPQKAYHSIRQKATKQKTNPALLTPGSEYDCLLVNNEICFADEIHFVDEIKSVLSSAVRRISSRIDFIHQRWIYPVLRTDLTEKSTCFKQVLFSWQREKDSNPRSAFVASRAY